MNLQEYTRKLDRVPVRYQQYLGTYLNPVPCLVDPKHWNWDVGGGLEGKVVKVSRPVGVPIREVGLGGVCCCCLRIRMGLEYIVGSKVDCIMAKYQRRVWCGVDGNMLTG